MGNDGQALCYASDFLRDDREVVLEAVSQSENTLEWASYGLRSDRGFALQVVRRNWEIIGSLFWKYNPICDREIVIAALSDCPEEGQQPAKNLKNRAHALNRWANEIERGVPTKKALHFLRK